MMNNCYANAGIHRLRSQWDLKSVTHKNWETSSCADFTKIKTPVTAYLQVKQKRS